MKIFLWAALLITVLARSALAQIAPPSYPAIILTPGSAPGSPTNGELWTTSSGLYARINGGTVGPYGTGGNLTDSGATFITAASPTIPSTYSIALFDPTSNAISATIQACDGGTKWDQWFKDATGQAEAHTITLTPSSGTVDGSATAQIGSAHGSLHIHSNGGVCVIL